MSELHRFTVRLAAAFAVGVAVAACELVTWVDRSSPPGQAEGASADAGRDAATDAGAGPSSDR